MGRSRHVHPAIVLVLATIVTAASTGSVGAAGDRSARVVVIKSGLMRGGEGSGYAEYGLVLRNRSPSRDALGVTVTVKAIDSRGRSFTTDAATITLIPAATDFVLTGALTWGVSLSPARIATAVRVLRSAPRGRKLPRVMHTTLANGGHDIVGSLTNPYKRPLPENATIYGVFLDSAGRIVAAGDEVTDAVVRPGATVTFDVFGNFMAPARADAVASAQASVDPCGLQAFTAACPIAGARGT